MAYKKYKIKQTTEELTKTDHVPDHFSEHLPEHISGDVGGNVFRRKHFQKSFPDTFPSKVAQTFSGTLSWGFIHSDRRSARNGCHGMLLERRSGVAQGLSTMKGQAKCAKGIFLGCFLDSGT